MLFITEMIELKDTKVGVKHQSINQSINHSNSKNVQTCLNQRHIKTPFLYTVDWYFDWKYEICIKNEKFGIGFVT